MTTENQRDEAVARTIIDGVVRDNGVEVFLGEGYGADDDLYNAIVSALTSLRQSWEREKKELELEIKKYREEWFSACERYRQSQDANTNLYERVQSFEQRYKTYYEIAEKSVEEITRLKSRNEELEAKNAELLRGRSHENTPPTK